MAVITDRATKPPLLDIKRIGHGTLESRDLVKTRRFYEEVLGFDVIQTSPRSLLIRKGLNHSYAVVENPKLDREMSRLNHNGLDVPSREAVDRAYQLLAQVKDEYDIHKLSHPAEQHGDYAFYFQDLDGNWWEIVAVDESANGYVSIFSDPSFDLTGRHELDGVVKGHVHDAVDRERFTGGQRN